MDMRFDTCNDNDHQCEHYFQSYKRSETNKTCNMDESIVIILKILINIPRLKQLKLKTAMVDITVK